jgi:hypothetical protein
MVQVLKYGPGFMFDESTMVRIDRTTEWGNPFIIGVDGDRDEVCDKHEIWLSDWVHIGIERKIVIGARVFSNKWVIEHIEELKRKNLVCWCTPERCHGDTLVLLANK